MNPGERVNLDKQLALYEQSNRTLQGPGVIPKGRVGVLTAWFGKQMYDYSDHGAFMSESAFSLRPPLLADFFIPDADEIDEPSPLRPVAHDLAIELRRIHQPLAVFVIATPRVAELSYTNHLPAGILEYRLKYTPTEATFVYKIIFGYGFSNYTYRNTDPHFTEEEIISRQLGGVFLPFNGDYPSVSCRRLVEFINRILGVDLPGDEFPKYTPDEVEKIAWNATRENFNAGSPREGAIPKYPIINGRPLFPF